MARPGELRSSLAVSIRIRVRIYFVGISAAVTLCIGSVSVVAERAVPQSTHRDYPTRKGKIHDAGFCGAAEGRRWRGIVGDTKVIVTGFLGRQNRAELKLR